MQASPSFARLRLLTDDELEREFGSGGHDEATRQAILFERLRRLGATAPRQHSNGLNWAILVVALLAALLAGVAAFPVIEGMFETEWFDF